ncbi:MAG: bifunctional UDP-3-O-[3-hydroxymyristoyl] N-acetylglucosamine deacetylase/3-hydroxyacyl-ACP dehydratase [Bacteroidales bacterium]|nr:bifunctional UDP-3-O-[3-hydroxymyristoyl] N-acetylglucosamine deacetylase/3-hydroxyacyl-ACP dehydratase [Bacteroidales bacterium]MCF8388504.1 bifunctional UDP-3-O-[3-hydroxymyristoyl] N-acetylglucosamine deacetylase/3-hydroxyacyl-ACP dehydratase [Bacteroidales bacterium]MCF8396741.1 bifunctional UDP-3-O-[3-hydroxymyristoyl] N-acetylglucosamine deacetylase/3-hydroxyacyl-ACP dehydratase [Bacteroidales bacterium]
MSDKQKTINKPVTVSGTGLHTGRYANLTFKPAPENHGIMFQRVDVKEKPIIAVDVDAVVDTSRGTTIEKNGYRVYTIEHVMAALAGAQIDNVLIEIDQVETPIKDGSSRYFYEAIKSAGIVEQIADKRYIEVKEEIIYKDPKNNVELKISPDKKFKVDVDIDYETKVLGKQNAVLENIDDFEKEISKCRTFVFLHELEFLLNNNLIKGGDLSNAIVFVNRLVSQQELDRLADLFNKPKVKVLKEGILNNLELHFPNEPARHKLLDVVGDLSLLGKPIRGRITAKRPGHHSNVEFAKLIKKHINHLKMSTEPKFDLNKEPVLDVKGIQRLLPHRPPFLFIDKILEMTDTRVVGLKNVTMNETFFVGHFPNEPVMPGVIQIEAMAQCGGVLVLNPYPDPENYTTLFLKIENVKFRKIVVPGDTIVFDLELISPVRRGIAHMSGKAYVGNHVVMEAQMMASIKRIEGK